MLMAVGAIACSHSPPPPPMPLPSLPPPNGAAFPRTRPATVAAPTRTCHCFDWVHLDEFGYECFETAFACTNAHATSGFIDRTECRTTILYPQCVKVGCKGGTCYRYGENCPPAPSN